MSIRTTNTRPGDPVAARLRRKADQAWEMAGLARQDRDEADAKRHTDMARAYERQLKDWLE